MKSIKIILAAILLFTTGFAKAQTANLNEAGATLAISHSIVDTLTSPFFWGRGYTKDGMKKAATYLSEQFAQYKLLPLGKDYLQHFAYDVNTFPGKMELSINGKDLMPGRDFIVAPESNGGKGKGDLVQADSITYVDRDDKLILQLLDKLTWSVSDEAAEYKIVLVDKKAISSAPQKIKFDIENEIVKDFDAANICGFVKGSVHPDSMIFITAHYDHLGGMGKDTYFPGANDNASGIALLLQLAKYYSIHPAPYSIGFICFAGEEAGLKGSKYFTEHPVVPLEKIRFLINTDLAGTGEEGITVVNATEFPAEFAMMNAVNDQQHLLSKINARGKAANSDHYWFSEKGVPAFFFYTLGGIKAYHDVFDKAETLPLNEQVDLFKLITGFVSKLQNQ